MHMHRNAFACKSIKFNVLSQRSQKSRLTLIANKRASFFCFCLFTFWFTSIYCTVK